MMTRLQLASGAAALILLVVLAVTWPGRAASAATLDWVQPLLQQNQSPATALDGDAQAEWVGPDGRTARVVVQAPRLATGMPRVDLRPPADGSDARASIEAALAQLRTAGGGRLVLAAGTYSLSQVDKTKGCQLCVEDLHDVSIEGDGALLVFGQNADGIVIARSQRVKLSGLRISYSVRTSSFARIVEQDGRKLLKLEAGGDATDEVHQMVEFDPGTGRWPSSGARLLFPTGDARQPALVSPGLYASDAFASLATGLRVTVHHHWYGGIAIRALDTRGPTQNEDLTLERLRIDNSPGMGIVGYGVRRGFAVLDSRVGPAAGLCTALSTEYDAIHVQYVSGDILIRGNHLACSGDDAINIDSPVHPIVSQVSSNVLRIGRYSRFIRADDDLALFDPQNHWLGTVRVSGAPVALGGLDYQVSTQGTLPTLPATVLARDLQLATLRYAVIDNDIGPCACNAVLAQAPHGLVRDNRITGASHAAVKLLSNTGVFLEGTGAFNVLVERNVITDSGMGKQTTLVNGDWGAISVYGLGPGTLHDGPTNADITISANSVTNTEQACIAVTSTWRVKVVDNQCANTNQARTGPSLRFSYSSDIQVTGNARSGTSTGGLQIDSTNGTTLQAQTDY